MSQEIVGEWMHRGVISCPPETPIEEVARIMDTKDISALAVVDKQGDLIGLISRTDLVNARFVEPYMKHWRGMAAQHLMSRPVITVRPSAAIREAAELLREKRIHRLVVVEGEGELARPVGILSVTDLARRAVS